MKRFITPLLAAGIFAGNAAMNAPMFMPGELPFRGSIEGSYAGMARFVAEHPNPWGWNPLQYCGLPVQFMYLPLLPYSTALIAQVVPHAQIDYIYRLITAIAACLGPVVLFLFAVRFTGSRVWSLVAALAYSVFSPSYGLFPAVDRDRGMIHLPWRMQVLAKYGEGPHCFGLTLLPMALWALWRTGVKEGYARIFTAAILLAAIVLTNWVAAMALAISSLLLLFAATGEPGFRFRRPLAAAALAYGLACFWLTPSFIRIIAFNWPADAFGYRFASRQVWMLVILAAGLGLIRFAFWKWRASFYICLVTLAAFTFGAIATGFYMFGVDTLPESRRYALEFEFFLMMALAEGARQSLSIPNLTIRVCTIGTGIILLIMGIPQLRALAASGPSRWKPAPRENTIEYRLARWLSEKEIQGRVFASGGLRFRLNSWFEIPQVGGGFETGLRSFRMPVHMAYRIRTAQNMRSGHEAADTLVLLKALGTEYLVVHGPKSKEYYRDFAKPERLASLPVVLQEEDDTIYALPSFPLAFVITRDAVPEGSAHARPWGIEKYIAAREASPLRTSWHGTSKLTIDGAVPDGGFVAVQVNAGPGWRALQDGREIGINEDGLGYMLLFAAPAASTHIELEHRATAEQRLMAALSGVVWLAAMGGFLRRR